MSDPIQCQPVWNKGDKIPYRETDPENPKQAGDRYLYLVLHDQGGYEFVVIGYLHGEFRTSTPDDQKWFAISSSLDNDRDPEHFMRTYTPPLVPWLRVPALDTDGKLSGWWNICAWAELPLPVWEPPAGFYTT